MSSSKVPYAVIHSAALADRGSRQNRNVYILMKQTAVSPSRLPVWYLTVLSRRIFLNTIAC